MAEPRPLIAAAPRVLVTRRYSEVKRLRRRGLMGAAGPPCDMDGCAFSAGQPEPRTAPPYVYEHCHQHDYIRGVTCGFCNFRMMFVDARVDECADWPRYLAWRMRCPECSAGPPWEPWLTRAEYEGLTWLRSIADLGRAEPGSPAAAEILAALALYDEGSAIRARIHAMQVERATEPRR